MLLKTIEKPNTLGTCYVPVVLFLHQVVPGSKGDQMCVVSGRGYGHGAGTPHVCVAQLVRQHLQLVRVEVVVVPQHVVVRRSTRALQSNVNVQIKRTEKRLRFEKPLEKKLSMLRLRKFENEVCHLVHRFNNQKSDE